MTSTETTAKSSAKSELWDNVQTILVALLLAMCIRFVVAQPFRIPSGSMQPTLLVGDYIIVTKWSYGYSRFSLEPFNFGWPEGRVLAKEPKRGDIVVFRPATEEDKDFVKRLIGLPGDKVQMREGVLYINGAAVPREATGTMTFKDQYGYVSDISTYKETLPGGVSYTTFDRGVSDYDTTGVYEVPGGYYFMMGDDRDQSLDSRTPQVSFVPYDHLVGHAQFTVLSFDPTRTELFLPWTWVTGLRSDRFFRGVS